MHTTNLPTQCFTINRLPSAYSEAMVQILLLGRRTSFLPKPQEEALEIKENSWACAMLGGVWEDNNTGGCRGARAMQAASFMHLVPYKMLPTGYWGGMQHNATTLSFEACKALIMSAWDRNIQKNQASSLQVTATSVLCTDTTHQHSPQGLLPIGSPDQANQCTTGRL